MARQRETARKSTSGRAPRVSLTQPRSYYSYGKPSPDKQVASDAAIIASCDPIPPEMPDSPAQRTVLSTPDLLVIILSQLPHSSLLKAQRVNKTWGMLFDHVEIRAALFQVPRPAGSASYCEAFSDVLMDHFVTFWPRAGENKATFPRGPTVKTFHPEGWSDTAVDTTNTPSPSELSLGGATTTLEPEQQQQDGYRCPCEQQWRDLLICQPPIKDLELVHEVDIRGRGCFEHRAIIHRPQGLRMGFLYDVVRYWHKVERSGELLWSRRTGDLTHDHRYYVDSPGFKTTDDKPCLTVFGHNGVGCSGSRGLTYKSFGRVQVIESGDEEIEYRMSKPQRVSLDLSFLEDAAKEVEENAEDQEEED